MELLLVLAGFVLFILPIVSFIQVLGAKEKLRELEASFARVSAELARFRAEYDRNKLQEQNSTKTVAHTMVVESNTQSAQPAPTAPLAPLPPLVPLAQSAQASVASIASESSSTPEATPAATVASVPPPINQTKQVAAKQRAAARPVALPKPSITDAPWFKQAKAWLFGGNMVAKVGLLILFFGVSFLLKYVAAQVTVPIELRLAGIVLADIALLVWAWRIRETRAGISLPVQGAALAILMLVTFGAFRLYQLIPSGLAFGLLFVLTVFTCLLAVLQNALWLAVFGIAGGFLAPILTSTGQGSYIGLFSYYALLNAGVLAIALMRSWRLLNVISFAFTFVIGTAWGVTKYLPENYLPSQLFLILFYLFYVAIAIIYAKRQATQLGNYVDATLVFGTPLVGFSLQYGLVKNMPFGLAFSALALGLFYISTALVMWKKRGTSLKLLAESFLALGIVFGTLAIPFALDGRWTSAAWALEGAGIVWIGLRQKQPLAWVFGLFVQAGAWISFLGSIAVTNQNGVHQSNLWLGFLLLAGTAFFMATRFRSQSSHPREEGDNLPLVFSPIATVFLALASIWFVAGAWTEIFMRTKGATQASLLVVSALITATGLAFIAKRLEWRVARAFAVIVQIIAGLTLLGVTVVSLDWPTFHYQTESNLLDGPFLSALLITIGALVTSRVFKNNATAEPANMGSRVLSAALLAWAGFWWYAIVLYELTSWTSSQFYLWRGLIGSFDGHTVTAYGIGVAISGVLWSLLAQRLQWAELRLAAVINYFALALTTLILVLCAYGLLLLGEWNSLPDLHYWIAYGTLWIAAEWLMTRWLRRSPHAAESAWLKFLHAVRTGGAWLLIWPLAAYWVMRFLTNNSDEQSALLYEAGWQVSKGWSHYLPVWAMMGVLAWLISRTYKEGLWPVAPIGRWYRTRLIPLGVAWSLLLVVIWNLHESGTMTPLPYLPILNPLDLSTGFAALLGVVTYRMLQQDRRAHLAPNDMAAESWLDSVPKVASFAAYGWFNLLLLRSVSHYLAIPYEVDSLFQSQFVQAMLSLVWSATALMLMWRAVKLVSRQRWMLGAGLLALVVAKLFLVDLSNVGGIERIISFVGVGLLMVAIGYLAPYPNQGNQPDQDADSTNPKVDDPVNTESTLNPPNKQE